MGYFEYEKIAREANIPPDKLEELRQLVRREFPKDDMMYELHLLRICMAIKQGFVTIAEAIQAEPAINK
ncbi:MAG: hypothetical protein ACRERE_35555 [Candidatus Entotheonellia bacterium]